MKILFCFVIFITAQMAAICNTVRNPDQNRLIYVQYAILLFSENFQRLPESWSDLRKYEPSKKYVDILKADKENGFENDFIETFRFIDNGTEIRIRGGKERVIAMATRSMARFDSEKQKPASRLLVIQTEDGAISSRQYTEEVISRSFKIAGFDISDFTGNNGKWQPEARQEDEGEEIKEENGDTMREDGIEMAESVSSENKRNDARNENDESETGGLTRAIWVMATLTLAILTMLLVALMKKRKLLTRSENR